MTIEAVTFADVRFDLYNKRDLIEELFSIKNDYKIVVTPNVDHVVRANKDKVFKKLYSEAHISVNDSRILHKLTRLIKLDLGTVIPGSDLTKSIIERISGKDVKITLIGCSNETVKSVRKKYDLKDVAHYNPPMGFINNPDEIDKCVRFTLENPGRFIFLAVGSPRQEILAKAIQKAGGTGVALCIGASFLFLSGEEKRAPLFMQKLSLEWLFRLLQSPRRLAKRYLIDGMNIFPLLLKEKFK